MSSKQPGGAKDTSRSLSGSQAQSQHSQPGQLSLSQSSVQPTGTFRPTGSMSLLRPGDLRRLQSSRGRSVISPSFSSQPCPPHRRGARHLLTLHPISASLSASVYGASVFASVAASTSSSSSSLCVFQPTPPSPYSSCSVSQLLLRLETTLARDPEGQTGEVEGDDMDQDEASTSTAQVLDPDGLW